MTPSSLPLVVKALHFAAQQHRNQRRKDADTSPYINHPIALLQVLVQEGGIEDPEILAAALLHDTIEDCGVTAAELSQHFGSKVSAYVVEVTDDKSLAKEARKQAQIDHAPHLSAEAQCIKVADKICNLRDLLNQPPADWPMSRKAKYFVWASQVIGAMPTPPPSLKAIADLLIAEGLQQVQERG